MQRMTPNDLDSNTLRITMKGYDRAQVEVLFERARNEIATLVGELSSARADAERQQAELTAFQGQENILKDTLLVAQRAAEDIKATAQREADRITTQATRAADETMRQHESKIEDANREAEKIIDQAMRTSEETVRQYEAKINDLRWELERLRTDRQKFTSEFRGTLEAFLRTLNEESYASGSVATIAIDTKPESVVDADPEPEPHAIIES